MNKQERANKRMAKAREARQLQIKQKIERTYGNLSWMFSRSCIDRMSLDTIAELCRVDYEIIWYALEKLGIPRIIMVGRDKWWEWVEKHTKKIAYREM